MARKLEHIAFVTANYPSAQHPYGGMFVQQLVHALAREGTRCSVIHPIAVHRWLRAGIRKDRSLDIEPEDVPVRVYRPVYPSFSSKQVGPLNTARATQLFFDRAAWRAVRRLDGTPSVVYGHFLYPGGAAAVHAAKRLGIPSVVAVGEGEFWTVRPMGFPRAIRDYRDVDAVVAVSSVIKRNLTEDLRIPAEKIGVFPNGADLQRFYPRDRQEMRRKLGLPPDGFLVAFVGSFLQGKGADRVGAAIDGLDGVGGVFAGAGPCKPGGANVLFTGMLSHDQVPELLSAADVFVLPTLIEGSCNAIVEAMACGLPIVTSEGEFNDDLVDSSVSIRVDPLDVAAIRAAILRLRDDAELRREMGHRARQRALDFDVTLRARRIRSWIAERM